VSRERDIAFWNDDTLRQYAEIQRGYHGAVVFCNDCPALDGPDCCRTLERMAARRRGGHPEVASWRTG
jgi:hypothetical protein